MLKKTCLYVLKRKKKTLEDSINSKIHNNVKFFFKYFQCITAFETFIHSLNINLV